MPLARLWLRELEFPSRRFGTEAEPLMADISGRFAIGNVFVGPLRASAWDSGDQELRGDWTGALSQEGEVLSGVFIAVGGEGTGAVRVSVVDPNNLAAPVANAEVGLYRTGLFDFTTTDGGGTAAFQGVPAGSYAVTAYSKALGKSGATTVNFNVARDQTTDVRVLLVFAGKVDGTLTDPEGTPANRPIAGAQIDLSGFNFTAAASTDLAGAFAFEGVREGPFQLDAKDTVSNRRARGSGSLSAANPHPVVNLQLEPTETLHVAVYLPDDTGAKSNVLAPPFAVEVFQRCAGGASCDVRRAAQDNPAILPGLLRNESYAIALREIGGLGRSFAVSGAFPKGNAADPIAFVLPAYGDVEVSVVQGTSPASGAKIEIGGTAMFADASGRVIVRGLRLGTVSAQATSVDGRFSGSVSGTLERQSVILRLTIELGDNAGITGLVEAETGGPSAGTRVVAGAAELVTDGEGRYTFKGIRTPSTVGVTYIGPDGVTIGARQSVTLTTAHAQTVLALPTVRLDATPPQIVSVTPPDNAANVSPDLAMRITFSERIPETQLTTANLQLVAADGSGAVATSISGAAGANGTFIVTLDPVAPRLASNTLHRVIVSGSITDLTGHPLPAPLGTTFTTADYVEPRVVKTVPATTTPVPEQVTFEFHFNEPVDPAPWQPGGGASLRFFKTTAAGAVLAEKSGRAFIDPATALVLLFGPDAPIEPESHYRIVFSGIRDLQGNALGEQTFQFFSFDRNKPVIHLVSPVPEGFSLVSGVEYTLRFDTTAGDIASADYSRVDGANETYLTTIRTAPWAYRFVAPDAPEAGLTLTLRVKATDGSGNVSEPSSMTWTVKPNAPPKNVSLTLAPTAAYPANDVTVTTAFEDEGTFATVQVVFRGTRSDGAEYAESKTKQLTRATVADPWPSSALTFSLPANLKTDAPATFTATVTDVRGLAETTSLALTLRTDATPPSFVSLSPAPETRFALSQKFQAEAVVSDGETGVASVLFVIDGQTFTVTTSTAGTVAGTRKFATPLITVPAKNTDTRVSIAATATDFNSNNTTRAFEVVYIGVNDPTVPKGAWICPVDRAAVPASQSAFALPLRVRATDDISVTGVRFIVPGLAQPVVATRSGTTDDYTATATIATPAAGETLVITAEVSDADATHTIQLPITLDAVAVDIVVNTTQAITSSSLAQYENKSVAVTSPAGRLVSHVPVTLANLLVMGGARVDSLSTTTTNEYRVDITVADHLYVDCDSSIDVSGKGYLGGWGVNDDGSNTRNDSALGRVPGNTTTGGPSSAGASHGGLGQVGSGEAAANLTYGSITAPIALGGGGAGAPGCCAAGGSGGGAIALRASAEPAALGRFAIAGSIRADGRVGAAGGAGGSVAIEAKQLVLGAAAVISANGGDGPPAGGGGRLAVTATERFDVAAPLGQLQARSGPQLFGVSTLEPGAGTVFLRRPSQQWGELLVSPYGAVSGTHFTRATPLAGAALHFDRVEVGPFALARFDDAVAIDGATAVDSTGIMLLATDVPVATFTTAPAGGSGLIRNTELEVTLDAASRAGIAQTRFELASTSERVETLTSYPQSFTARKTRIAVPVDAPLGPAALNVRITDRADRVVNMAPATFTFVDNLPPVITSFTAVPDSLYPGRSITATVTASDDVAVTKLSVSSIISTAPPVVQNAATATQQFTITVPIATPGGTPMTLEAAAEDGFPARPPTRTTKTISVRTDTVAPSVTMAAPSPNQTFDEGTGATFVVRASAVDGEVGVKTIVARVGSAAAVPMTADGSDMWRVTLAVPSVDGSDPVPISVTVTATDYEGNSGGASVPILVRPLVDPNAPTLRWTCSTSAAMVPPGYAVKLRVFAKGLTGANGVERVEFFVPGSEVAIPATPIPGLADHYEASWTTGDLPDDASVTVRAVATSVAGNVAELSTAFRVARSAVPAITSSMTIDATNAATYANQTVIVQGGTLTVNGPQTFDRLLVLHGATVTHAPDQRLALTVTRGVFVACDGQIDATGKGFGPDRSYPDVALLPGNGSGGSHIGTGGRWDLPLGSTFGSVYHPQEAGGGGQHATDGGSGGGVIRISAASLSNEGAIRANGTMPNANGRGGAGGSIWITADVLSGSGSLEARGGEGRYGAGGGGAIAIEHRGITIPWTLNAATHPNGARFGGAGSILVKRAGSIWGELTVDNGGRIGEATNLPALGRGVALAGSGGTTLVTDRTATIPAYFAGHSVEIVGASGPSKGIWRVDEVQNKTLKLAAGANVVEGDRWIGTYRLDAVELRSTRLVTEDRLVSTAAPQLDAASSISGNNQGPPILNVALISLRASALGTSLVGLPGAVTDPDVPVMLLATNLSSGVTVQATAGPDGSFAMPVSGNAGDRISIKARDGNLFPLESVAAAVPGSIPASNPAPAQIAKENWTSDPSFRPQVLASEGRVLVAASSGLLGASSDKLVVFDTLDPAAPAFLRTVSTGSSIQDAEIVNGIAYIAAGPLLAVDVSSATPRVLSAPGICGGATAAVAVQGGWAYTSDAGCGNNGRIYAWDVSNSAVAPRLVRQNDVAISTGSNHVFTDLLAYGSGYLIAVSTSADGRDVMIFDSRDVNGLRLLSELSIADFTSFRGRVDGRYLYLVGATSAELVVVDLGDPAAPAITARAPLAAGGRHVRTVSGTAFVAAGTAGLLAASAAPASVAASGGAAVGGVASDVVASGRYLYVANESGIAVLAVTLPPVLDVSRVSMTTASGTSVDVTGGARALAGDAPIQVQVRDADSAASMTVTAAADGGFSVTLPAGSGDRILLTATDAAGRVLGPVPIGIVPFGSATRVEPIELPGNPNFRARTVKIEGSRAVVSSLPSYDSDRILVYDLTLPTPQLRHTIATSGAVRDVELVRGIAYVAAGSLALVDLNDAIPVARIANGICGGQAAAVAVAGGWAFVSDGACGNNGRIYAYDVSNPASAPRLVSQNDVAVSTGFNHPFTDLLPYGTDYLVAVSNSGDGKDLMVFDRRDANVLRPVSTISIPEIVAFRGRLIGSTLYLAGEDAGIAVVDVSNPTAPRLIASAGTPGVARGIEVSGSTVVVADLGSGVSFLRLVNGELQLAGTQAVGGSAWDVALGGSTLYVANEQGLAIVSNVVAPPQITASLIAIGATGNVAGGAGAVAGQGPIGVEVRNATTSAAVTGAVSGDGAFQVAITGSAGDVVTVKAVDAFGRIAGPVGIGAIPFGSSTTVQPIVIPNDANFRARTVKVEGPRAVVVSHPSYASDKVLVYDVANAATPVLRQTLGTNGPTRDVELVRGVAYIASGSLVVADLNMPAPVARAANGICGGQTQAVAISAGYAFVSDAACGNNGRIYVYDVSGMGNPLLVAQNDVATSTGFSHAFTDLFALGDSHLIAVSNSLDGRDLMIFDRRNVGALVKVAELSIPDVSAFRGRLVDSTLYLAGEDAGVAMVDVSDPAAPRVVSTAATPGVALGLEVSGTTVVVADLGSGLTFFDTSTGALRSSGTHVIGGNAWDVVLAGSVLLAANEQGLAIITDAAVPPSVAPSLISIAKSSVWGSEGAVGGRPPLQLSIARGTTTLATVAPSPTGAFVATVAASEGQKLSLTATDASARTNSRSIGTVPFVTVVVNQPAFDGDTNLFGRRIGTDGTNVVVTNGAVNGTRLTSSGRMLLFRQPNASEPPALSGFNANLAIDDLEVRGSQAYVAGDRFAVVDYAPAAPVRYMPAANPGGSEGAVALAGNFAFTADRGNNTGTVHVYNVTSPSSPAYLRSQAMATAPAVAYRDLVTSGSVLFAVSPDSDRAVTIIDAANVNALVRLSELSIPNFSAYSGAVSGITLYVAGGDGGIAIVDVANPAAPQVLAVVDTPGSARAVAISGTNEIVIADGTAGLTFIDTTQRAAPVVLGSQSLDGTATDVRVSGNRILAATETRFYVLTR